MRDFIGRQYLPILFAEDDSEERRYIRWLCSAGLFGKIERQLQRERRSKSESPFFSWWRVKLLAHGNDDVSSIHTLQPYYEDHPSFDFSNGKPFYAQIQTFLIVTDAHKPQGCHSTR